MQHSLAWTGVVEVMDVFGDGHAELCCVAPLAGIEKFGLQPSPEPNEWDGFFQQRPYGRQRETLTGRSTSCERMVM